MMMYVRAPSQISYHIHYINSDLCCHSLIDGCGILPSLYRIISYLRTIFAYNLFISVSSSFFYTMYPVLSPLVSTLDSILPTSVSTLDSIYSLFKLPLTLFITFSLVEGGLICRVYTCIHTMITSRNFVNRAPCKDFVKKSASMFSVLKYEIEMFLL